MASTPRGMLGRRQGATAMLLGMVTVAIGQGPVLAGDLVLNLPAQVIIEDHPAPGPNDPDRCLAGTFAEFPAIRNAKGYEVTLSDVRGTRPVFSGPPFPDDDFVYGPAHWVAPAGFHRFSTGSLYSTGAGCAQAILGVDGIFSVLRAKVNMNRRFKMNFRRPYTKCLYTRLRPDELPVIGRKGDILEVERMAGVVTVRTPEMGGAHPINKQIWVGDGPNIIQTSNHAWVRITNINGGGRSFLVGPGTKVRLEAGERPEMLHIRPGMGLEDVIPPGGRPRYEIRTPNCVFAAQG